MVEDSSASGGEALGVSVTKGTDVFFPLAFFLGAFLAGFFLGAAFFLLPEDEAPPVGLSGSATVTAEQSVKKSLC